MLPPLHMKQLNVPQSGSMAATTASRNRFGQYLRSRAMPVNPNSTAQVRVRNALSAAAKNWRTLTDPQQAGWKTLGAQVQRVDSLGQTYFWNGFMCFVAVQSLLSAGGQPATTDAPSLPSPPQLETLVVTLSTTAFSLAYTATPLTAEQQLYVYASEPQSAGRSYNKQYKLIACSAVSAASPMNVKAAYEAIYGPLTAGYRVFVRCAVVEDGFPSAYIDKDSVIA